MKKRIRRNIWGNWNGYEGAKKTQDFGTQEDLAKEWLQQTNPTEVTTMNHERYMDKGNRDQRARELKAQGYEVTRRSSGPCELHPMYVKDFQWQHSLTQMDSGFGNTQYKTYFGNTYVVEYRQVA